MDKIDSMRKIKLSLLCVKEMLNSSKPEDVKDGFREYAELVDEFYRENKDFVAPQQYETAKTDFEYFMQLIELAVAYYDTNKEGINDR